MSIRADGVSPQCLKDLDTIASHPLNDVFSKSVLIPTTIFNFSLLIHLCEEDFRQFIERFGWIVAFNVTYHVVTTMHESRKFARAVNCEKGTIRLMHEREPLSLGKSISF